MEVKILIVNENKDFHSKLSCERMCIDFAVQLKVSEIFVSSKNSAMRTSSGFICFGVGEFIYPISCTI